MARSRSKKQEASRDSLSLSLPVLPRTYQTFVPYSTRPSTIRVMSHSTSHDGSIHASPFIRLKLLVAPPLSAEDSPSPACGPVHSYRVKKVAVPREMPWDQLMRKLSVLCGIGGNGTCQQNQAINASFSVALDAPSTLSDASVASSHLVAGFTWSHIATQDEWIKACDGKEKLLARIIPSAICSNDPSVPVPSVGHGRPCRSIRRLPGVIPTIAPGPWPKFQPDRTKLPLIIMQNDEHEWELLEDDEMEAGDDGCNSKSSGCCGGKCGSQNGSCGNQNGSCGRMHAKPTNVQTRSKAPRRLPADLLERLTGGKELLDSVGSTAVPPTSVTFDLNGSAHTVENPSPDLKLIDYLRTSSGYTGQKIGCGEGGCGACTVVLSKQDPTTGKKTAFSTNGCLHPVAMLDGWAVMTAEFLGNVRDGLHPIQANLVKYWGTQCGYCSPGFVMSMYGLLQNNPNPSLQDVEDRFDGNLCRCTGYRPILAGMRAAAGIKNEKKNGGEKMQLKPCGKGDGARCSSEAKDSCASKGICCGMSNGSSSGDMEDLVYDSSNPRHNLNPFSSELLEYNHSKLRQSPQVRYLSDERHIWIEPAMLQDVFNILRYFSVERNEAVKLVVGNSSTGVTEKYYPKKPCDAANVFVNLTNLAELQGVKMEGNNLVVGATVTLNDLISNLQSQIDTLPHPQTRSWIALVRHLKMVANTGVRNVGCWAGNLVMAKTHPEFPSDLFTLFAAVGAQLVLKTAGTSRSVKVIDFHQTEMAADEIVYQLLLPTTPDHDVFDSYKVRARHQNSHPIVNAAFNFTLSAPAQHSQWHANPPTISNATLVIGGLTGNGIFVCPQTSNYLKGKALNADTLKGAVSVLDGEAIAGDWEDPACPHLSADPGYRHSLVLTLFYKFYLEQMNATGVDVPSQDQSAFEHYQRPISSGAEVFFPDASEKPVGEPLPKLEAPIQTTGEAKYTMDLPFPPNGLHAAFVYSTRALATIVSIDTSAAMTLPGVERFISAADISGDCSNDCGSFPGDEPIFAVDKVTATGQSIGMILADTQAHANAAAKLVVVNYADPDPPAQPILTIPDAIAANAFFQTNDHLTHPPAVSCGDFDQAYDAAPYKLDGVNTSAGQYHFFMETQTAYAIPSESGGLNVYSSSQGPTAVRTILIRATGLPAHKISVSTKRAGGAFGGKLSRSHPIACAVAIAALVTKRPVRCICDREVDMDMWGKRPDMLIKYKIGFDDSGKLLAYKGQFYQQGGHTYESNFGILSMALMWSDGAYFCPNFHSEGEACRTNTPSNTATRAPGAFRSMWNMELMMERIAWQLNMSPNAVREANFYQNNQLTPYGQTITDSTMIKVWSTLKSQANYDSALADVQTFNKNNRWRKRGIHCSTSKYGITDPGNQVGILINIAHEDGSLLVSHTGVELGQGINTKVAQTIAKELDIDMKYIIVDECATDKVSNGSQTGGSATSESACAAAINACKILNERLDPIKKANPGVTWSQLISKAASAHINLTVNSEYNLPDPEQPFTYFVWSASCSLVELDVLTGEVQVLRTDIVYDAGDSINPVIDIGQIEGAFIMALGHYLTEEVVYDNHTGRLLTRGTWDYHPPCSQDIPLNFNVTLLSKSPNPASGSILGSKATAEPPVMLASSVYLAVRDCIAAARADRGWTDWFDLPTPASTQNVQLACGITPDQLTVE